ncbi:RNA 2',3'-cyclic phosphodiesterase [Pyrinomonas methylaliphatogenes]|uniref:RNA 2',3'-cyclic phosphodiesterase n=1 Tax=Pyrinomonas methylaliphatogenes TaxID=454194 RepID=A0A0B6WVI0_9BACT|nr:RNA 2',3'-cyclic phosphodiesterase [Pyrinomonas methylaliphatogenes]MBX5477965.1 RNA 2',3'-cyclic phosphodiesterase [Pyrinomonas methylaliphatogenes]CDM64115.1 2'-5' RNA ligase [Pyrinomonas methylaliphatogenes]
MINRATDEAKSLRVFCAIALPDATRARLAERIGRLRASPQGFAARWERSEKLHLTLKFLGEIEASRLDALRSAAERAAMSVAPFELTLAGPGVFPPRGAARVLWLGLGDPSGRLAHLQASLEDECHKVGFPREARPFRPHITLARLRNPAPQLVKLHLELPVETERFAVHEMVIMRSELRPEGARYTELAALPLRGE